MSVLFIYLLNLLNKYARIRIHVCNFFIKSIVKKINICIIEKACQKMAAKIAAKNM